MRRRRGKAACSIVLVGVTIAATRCATPTQVIVEVKTDARCEELTTGIYVGPRAADTDSEPAPDIAKRACDRPGVIGAAVFVPSSDDAEGFALKVVTAVDATTEDCAHKRTDRCIVERRYLRYEQGKIVRATIEMSQRCTGVVCGASETCKDGECVPCPECVEPPDPNVDAGGTDAVVVDARFDGTSSDGAGGDASVDAAVDANEGGTGPCPSSCNGGCNGAICIIKDTTPATCPSGRPCEVRCTVKDTCNVIRCATGQPCKVVCGAPSGNHFCDAVTIDRSNASKLCVECSGPQACGGVDCSGPSPSCTKTCSGSEACKGGSCMSCATQAACP